MSKHDEGYAYEAPGTSRREAGYDDVDPFGHEEGHDVCAIKMARHQRL